MSLLLNLTKMVVTVPKRTFFGKKKYDLGSCNIVQVGKLSEERLVPEHIIKPDYYFIHKNPSSTAGTPEIKNNEQISGMRESCKLAANILMSCKNTVDVGVSTDEIDDFVHERIISSNAYPSPLRYGKFPKSICTSVNNVACHGIPDERKLMDGDIINVDITVYLNGFHGDCSKTFLVGNVDERGKFLVDITEKCLLEAISCCGPLRPFYLIGKCIEKIASQNNLNIIPEFIGHGIGTYFHGPPEIFHYKNSLPGQMVPGNVFTIEPILTLGAKPIEILEDGWTAVTLDNGRSAQFEHTVLITEDGCEILTVPD